jgi:hypothetical protein
MVVLEGRIDRGELAAVGQRRLTLEAYRGAHKAMAFRSYRGRVAPGTDVLGLRQILRQVRQVLRQFDCPKEIQVVPPITAAAIIRGGEPSLHLR